MKMKMNMKMIIEMKMAFDIFILRQDKKKLNEIMKIESNCVQQKGTFAKVYITLKNVFYEKIIQNVSVVTIIIGS